MENSFALIKAALKDLLCQRKIAIPHVIITRVMQYSMI